MFVYGADLRVCTCFAAIIDTCQLLIRKGQLRTAFGMFLSAGHSHETCLAIDL